MNTKSNIEYADICACGHAVSDHKVRVGADNSRKTVCTVCSCQQLRTVKEDSHGTKSA